MRTGILLLIVLVFIAGCDSMGNNCPSAEGATFRCGGGGLTLPGFRAVARGMDTAFFTATSRQSIEVKPGVEQSDILDRYGNVTGVKLQSNQGESNVHCLCPAGCKVEGSTDEVEFGCATLTDPQGKVTCVGDCVTENECCFGCGLWIQ